jgi:mRNA interferase MazF
MDEIFDEWNDLKKQISKSEKNIYCKTRDIWWCSVGMNIGSEINGKNHNFDRPVIILKVYNSTMILVAPITSRQRVDKYHFRIILNGEVSYIALSQIRVISSKRLIRKIIKISTELFKDILYRFISSI